MMLVLMYRPFMLLGLFHKKIPCKALFGCLSLNVLLQFTILCVMTISLSAFAASHHQGINNSSTHMRSTMTVSDWPCTTSLRYMFLYIPFLESFRDCFGIRCICCAFYQSPGVPAFITSIVDDVCMLCFVRNLIAFPGAQLVLCLLVHSWQFINLKRHLERWSLSDKKRASTWA